MSTNVIKLAHARLDELGEDAQTGGTRTRPPWYNLRLAPNRLWLTAMVVFVVANLANFASFAFAAQSLLAALGSIQFVSNVAFARLVNKERITRQTVVGTLVIVAGCIVLVLFGSHDSPVYAVGDLLALYGNPGYIAYLCVGATVAVASYGAFWWIKRTTGRRSLALYVLFSAVVGTQSVLYGKSLSLLFRAALDGTNVAAHWYSWVCLVAFLAAAVYWVRRFNKVGFGFVCLFSKNRRLDSSVGLVDRARSSAQRATGACAYPTRIYEQRRPAIFKNRPMPSAPHVRRSFHRPQTQGLQHFDVMTSMPAMQVGWILFSLVSGGLYFEEFNGFGALQWGMFSLGVVGVIAGVVCICQGGGRTSGRRASRRVSTLFDAVGVEVEMDVEVDAGGKVGEEHARRRMTAYCHVVDLERSDGPNAADVARRRNRTM